jgi:hypothetical protein
MHGNINVKFPNNISKWHMGFNSAFKGLIFCFRGRYVVVGSTRNISWEVKEAGA